MKMYKVFVLFLVVGYLVFSIFWFLFFAKTPTKQSNQLSEPDSNYVCEVFVDKKLYAKENNSKCYILFEKTGVISCYLGETKRYVTGTGIIFSCN